jgi:hypothetical protein
MHFLQLRQTHRSAPFTPISQFQDWHECLQIVPVSGGVDTLFDDGLVFYSLDGVNFGRRWQYGCRK